MIGKTLLKFRQKFEYGPRATWYRDYVRPNILDTSPIDSTNDTSCEIHALTCESDWLNLIWALKSFYIASNKRYALCVHDDGSLSQESEKIIRYHFPAARFIRRSDADDWADSISSKYPRVFEFRKKHPLSLKITDFFSFMVGDRMLVFDSDLLFFQSPSELINRVEDSNYQLNTFNEDIKSAYAIAPVEVEKVYDFRLISSLNSGLGLVHRGSVQLDFLEEFLALPRILEGHFWRIEQTLFALCSSRFGVELLPKEYQVSLERGIEGRPMRHYVGGVRGLMYSEGMRWLVREKRILDT